MNKNLKHFKDAVLILTCIKLFLPIILQNLLLSLNGNSENILSSRSNFVEAFSLCHWNLNGKTTQNYFKFFLLKVYLSAYAFNVTWILETYLILERGLILWWQLENEHAVKHAFIIKSGINQKIILNLFQVAFK